MKNYIKDNKGFTVKELIFTIVAIIIAFVAGFALSYIFKNDSKQYTDKINELENQIQQLQDGQYIDENNESNENGENNEEENEDNEPQTAEDILIDAYDEAIGVSSLFEYNEIENDDSKVEITNYDDAIKEVFTENGQKIYEEENKGVIAKSNGKVYMLLDSEDTSEYLYDFDFENINEKGDTITATVVRTMTKEPIIEMDDEQIEKLEKYTLKDELVIKKVNDNWLVDKYSWVITNQ